MLRLVRASTFYLTTTRAEGNCLPLMNYLAAGRPCVSPSHTAIADYLVTAKWVLSSSPTQNLAWPQDSPALADHVASPGVAVAGRAIRHSYRLAKQDRAAYEAMATARAGENAAMGPSGSRLAPLAIRHRAAGADAEAARRRRLARPEAKEADRAGENTPFSSARDTSAAFRNVPPVDGRHASIGAIKCGRTGTSRAPRIILIGRGSRHAAQRFSPVGSPGRSADATPMRVVVSLLNFRPGKIGGTETYLRQLIARLPEVDRQHQIVLLMDRDLAAARRFSRHRAGRGRTSAPDRMPAHAVWRPSAPTAPRR